jgi:hypothetical protein
MNTALEAVRQQNSAANSARQGARLAAASAKKLAILTAKLFATGACSGISRGKSI